MQSRFLLEKKISAPSPLSAPPPGPKTAGANSNFYVFVFRFQFRLRQCGLKQPIYLVEEFGSAQHMSLPESTLEQAIVNTQVALHAGKYLAYDM